MAYYNSSGNYQSSDYGEYHQTSYYAYNSNDFMTEQDSVDYSTYDEPSIYNLFDYNIPASYNYSTNYNHSSNCTPNWSSSTSTTSAYSVFTPTETKFIRYHDHNSNYAIAYDHHPQPQFVISYNSVSPEFDIPEFDEYDQTPYGGGYDIDKTYGKPLPPSPETCYPHSTKEVKAPSFDNEAKEEQKTKPQNGTKPKEAAKEEEKKSHENGQGVETMKPETKPESTEEISSGGDVFEYEKQVTTQIPSGYGLEAMDLCESIFGYWPCLSRYAKRSALNNGCHDSGFYDGISFGNQWYGAADYLFGNSDPYVEKRDGGGTYGQPIHCYEKHYQEPPLFIQVEPDEEDSWSQNFKIF